jgi:hypothetical protein
MRIEKFVILTIHAKTIDFQKSDFACFMKTYRSIRNLMSSKPCFGDMTGVACTRQEHEAALMFEKLNYYDTFP